MNEPLATFDPALSGDGFFVFDDTGRLRDVNASACASLDYDRTQLLHLSVQELKEKGATALVSCRAMQRGDEQRARCRLYRRDGSELMVDTHVQHFVVGDQRLYLVHTRPAGSEPESEALRWGLLGRLSAGIVHDFNNLLVAILGNAEVGLLKVDPGFAGYEELHIIQRAAHRLSELCGKILSYAKPAREPRTICALDKVCDETVELLKMAIPRNIALNTKTSPTAETYIDFTAVQQVLVNAIVNAVDAIGMDSGTVSLSCGMHDYRDSAQPNMRISRSDAADGVYAYFEIIDDGPGIPAEIMSHLFQTQVTTKNGGHGLGMSVVAEIVHDHDGFVGITSEPETGTVIRVFLPPA